MRHEDFQPVNFCRLLGSDGGAAFRFGLGDVARAHGCVGVWAWLNAMLQQKALALAESLWMGINKLHILQLCTGHGHEILRDLQRRFADDVAWLGVKQIVDFVDAAGGRIFDRQHAVVVFSVDDAIDDVLEM